MDVRQRSDSDTDSEEIIEYDSESDTSDVFDTGTDADTDADVDSDADSDADSDTDSDSDSDVDGDTDSDGDADTDADADGDADGDMDSDTDSDVDSDTDSDSDSDTNSESEVDTEIDTAQPCDGFEAYGICWFMADLGETCESKCSEHGGWDSGGAKSLDPYEMAPEADREQGWIDRMWGIVYDMGEGDNNSTSFTGKNDCQGVYVSESGNVFNGRRINQTANCDWEYSDQFRRLCACGDSGYEYEVSGMDTDGTDGDDGSETDDVDTEEAICAEGGYEFPEGEGTGWYYDPPLEWEESDCLSVCRSFGLEYDEDT